MADGSLSPFLFLTGNTAHPRHVPRLLRTTHINHFYIGYFKPEPSIYLQYNEYDQEMKINALLFAGKPFLF